MNQQINSDIVLVGLEGAGKTSIVSRIFKFFSTDEITKITPTVLMDASVFSLKIVQRPISVLDLGGQEQFLQQHLNNPTIFTNTNIIIYVIDIQRPDKLKLTLNYFARIKNIIRRKKNAPQEFLLLHKFDKSKKDELNFLLPAILTSLLDVLGNETTFFLTSIYDDTLVKVFTYILSFLFPVEVISQGLTHPLTTRILPATIEMVAKYGKNSINKLTVAHDFSKMFGKTITKNIIQRNWHKYFLTQLNIENDSLMNPNLKKKNATMRITKTKQSKPEEDLHLKSLTIFNYPDDNTLFFELNIPINVDEDTRAILPVLINQEFLFSFIINATLQGLIEGFCESVNCSLQYFSLNSQFNYQNNTIQVEGSLKCLPISKTMIK